MADMASELEAIAFRLRSAGEDGLARELTRAMRDAVAPVPGLIRAGLRPHLPDPYADALDADLDIRTIARSGSGADAAVSVYAQTRSGKRRRLRRLEGGVLEHPVFGDRSDWKKQGEPSVQPGWFSGPASGDAPRVRDALEQAVRDVAAKASKGA